MNLKEAFRYQNKLQALMDEAQTILDHNGNITIVENTYLRQKVKMVNGSVFGRLPRYAEESCWQENPVIHFDTVFEERQYAVMACFYSRLYDEYEPGFRFYEYFDLTSEDVFNEYVEQVSAAALYDTGVTAEYGDELLVLSTCSHYVEDGRFVVVAKRIA